MWLHFTGVSIPPPSTLIQTDTIRLMVSDRLHVRRTARSSARLIHTTIVRLSVAIRISRYKQRDE